MVQQNAERTQDPVLLALFADYRGRYLERGRKIWLPLFYPGRCAPIGPLISLPGGISLAFEARGLTAKRPQSDFHATAQGVLLMGLLRETAGTGPWVGIPDNAHEWRRFLLAFGQPTERMQEIPSCPGPGLDADCRRLLRQTDIEASQHRQSKKKRYQIKQVRYPGTGVATILTSATRLPTTTLGTPL